MHKPDIFIYIVRQIFLCNDYGCERIDDEVVFTTWHAARSYVRSQKIKKPTEVDLLRFRNRIIKIEINAVDGWEKRREWTYLVNDKLNYKADFSDTVKSDYDRYHYEAKYAVGDIVKTMPDFLVSQSGFIEEGFGVVWKVPEKKDVWVGNNNLPEDWDGMYLIFSIEDDGYLSHRHVPEKVIFGTVDKLSVDMEFLKELSMHAKGEKIISEKVLEEIFNKKIFVKKVNKYYFQK